MTNHITTQDYPFIKKWLAQEGPGALGKRLGLSGNYFAPSQIGEIGVRPAFEIAAKALWEQEHPKSGKRAFYAVQIPEHQIAVFKTFMAGLEARYMEWKF